MTYRVLEPGPLHTCLASWTHRLTSTSRCLARSRCQAQNGAARHGHRLLTLRRSPTWTVAPISRYLLPIRAIRSQACVRTLSTSSSVCLPFGMRFVTLLTSLQVRKARGYSLARPRPTRPRSPTAVPAA